MRFVRRLSPVVLVVMAVVWVGCGPGEPPVDEAREAEWAALVETKAQLDSLRQERAELAAELKAAGDEEAEDETAEGGEGEETEPTMTPEEMATKIAELEDTTVTKADEFMQSLVAYLNADPMIEGEAPTERQIAALRMKSSEDMVLAQEYIDKGGDHQRAIGIYENSLMLDPENEQLRAALEKAQAERYMSEERFALAKKGMTQDEIREVLGQVNLFNIREYEDRGVTAWFYPTSEGGFAAAVWFRENKRAGELQAYQLKYDAVSPESGGDA